ncbi:MAG: YihY/virulence factor BrkB family protein [Cyclobacteriaceae bacterium]|nr:YihY/virulence factor BrkB family protein [Cyclobacteriaceae bacterium]MCH8516645.1 YihY/virulence factor BrkB family protein [Cyclobacteriaceae bacterium]
MKVTPFIRIYRKLPFAIRNFIRISLKTFTMFTDDKVIKLAAALSYFTIFAIPGLMLVIISLTGFFLGEDAAKGKIFNQLHEYVGDDAAEQIETIIANISFSDDSLFATLLGIGVILFAGTRVFVEIQDSINQIWGVEARSKQGWLKMIIDRVISLSMMATISFLLLVSLILNAILAALGTEIMSWFPDLSVPYLSFINFVVTYVIIVLLFGLIFKVLPDAIISYYDAVIGSLVTGALFVFGTYGISFYLGQSSLTSLYGAAGSIIVLLLWIYYSSLILYLGAEFTQAFALSMGRKVKPKSHAVRIVSGKKDEIC